MLCSHYIKPGPFTPLVTVKQAAACDATEPYVLLALLSWHCIEPGPVDFFGNDW